MNSTFVQLAMFVADWKRMKLTDEDLQALEQLIMRRPDAGAVMPGTGGMRKLDSLHPPGIKARAERRESATFTW